MTEDYVNEGTSTRRCSRVFAVDVHLNRATPSGDVVLSTRGMRCGLDIEPAFDDSQCLWHAGKPEKVYRSNLREQLEAAVHARFFLGEAFLAGGLQNSKPNEPTPPALDLSGAVLNAAELPNAYLEGTILRAAELNNADLRGATIRGADLRDAQMREARLGYADLEGATMNGVDIWLAEIDGTTILDGVDWGNPLTLKRERNKEYARAEAGYRLLKQHYQNAGEYRKAGDFYFREMECIRRQRRPLERTLWTIFFKSTMGYGERPIWSLAWMAGVIAIWSVFIFPLTGITNTGGNSTPPGWPPTAGGFLNSLSLSLITFATLGYGNRYPASSWGELLAGFEAIIGVLLTSLFLVSFGKKVFRS